MGKRKNKFVIGLTGNIGTGKSEVRKILQCLGALGIDADLISRQFMEPDSPGYRKVLEKFGREFIDEEARLDRSALAKVVFNQPDKLAELEAIIHPLVKEEVTRLIDETDIPVVVIEAIKLIESGISDQCDSLWVTNSPLEVRLARLTLFREMSEDDARMRIQAQPPQEEKLKAADIIIQNNATLEDLLLQVKHAWSTVVPDSFRIAIQDKTSV
ncbi:MAG: dephospho-CoA kinase [Leptolinea sp.]|nr:dephospho-CoA kinase [Leptolinea sp.]